MPVGLVRLLILEFVLRWLVAPLLAGLVVFRLLRLLKRAIPGAAGFVHHSKIFVADTVLALPIRKNNIPDEENWFF